MANTTRPIKDRKDVERLKDYYKLVKPNARNYALIVVGLNTALRISDILSLKWRTVYDFKEGGLRDRFELRERKTGKRQSIPLNDSVKEALGKLFGSLGRVQPDDWVFASQKMGVSPSLMVELFNHSSYQVTKRYLGLGQDEKDEVYMKINL